MKKVCQIKTFWSQNFFRTKILLSKFFRPKKFLVHKNFWVKNKIDTSLVAEGILTHRLQNPKWPPGGPKMADGVWKGVQPKIIGHFILDPIFDPILDPILSQILTPILNSKSKMAARGPQNGQRGLERGLPLVHWPFRATFAK